MLGDRPIGSVTLYKYVPLSTILAANLRAINMSDILSITTSDSITETLLNVRYAYYSMTIGGVLNVVGIVGRFAESSSMTVRLTRPTSRLSVEEVADEAPQMRKRLAQRTV